MADLAQAGTPQALANPEIFWVVGTNTGVGKTTIASALVAELNRGGVPTVGFKPFGGVWLQELVDFGFDQVARSGCEICGGDAEQLALASPLTTASMLDIVGPMYVVGYPNIRRPLVARMGSKSLGNVRYLLNRDSLELLDRDDVADAVRRLGIDLAAAEARRFYFQDVPALHPAAQQDAYRALLSLRPRAVVCEGASNFLPIWADMLVNHVLMVTGEKVVFRPSLDRPLPYGRQLRVLDEIDPWLNDQRRSISRPMQVVPPADRDAVARAIVRSLLGEAMLDGEPLAHELTARSSQQTT